VGTCLLVLKLSLTVFHGPTGLLQEMHMAQGTSQRKALPFVILALIGSIFLSAAVFIGGRQAIFVFRAHRATATFQGAVAHTGGSHGGTFLYPQFHFTTNNGQSITFTSKDGSTGQPYSDGQAVPVLYDPGAPTHATLDHFWSLWAATVILGLFAFAFLGLSCLIWIAVRR
jgi:hypothetical protein